MVTRSRIKLFGLIHRVTIQRSAQDSDDGGGRIVPGTPTIIYENTPCRITRNTGAEVEHTAGLQKDDMWQVLFTYLPNLQENDIIVVPNNMKIPAGDYRAIKVNQEQDELGGFHHSLCLLEVL